MNRIVGRWQRSHQHTQEHNNQRSQTTKLINSHRLLHSPNTRKTIGYTPNPIQNSKKEEKCTQESEKEKEKEKENISSPSKSALQIGPETN
jgi:hypothetical protein